MSTIKTTYIQHPDATEPAIELTPGGAVALPLVGIGDLADVDEGSGAADGDVLTYDGVSDLWVPAAPAGVPTGAIMYFAADVSPSGFMKANGANISRSTYANLFSVIGETYGAGDGSTTFGIPDLRGEFIRGWDDSRGIDSGRVFGSFQSDELKSHTHFVGTNQRAFDSSNQEAGNGGNTAGDSSAAGGTETRPRNIALLACIKY